MAAVLAGGPGGFLSHRSAAEHLGLMTPSERVIDVTLPRWRAPSPVIRWHSSALPADETAIVAAIPVTTVPRTLLDLAAVLDRRGVEQAMGEAEFRGYTDRLSLPTLLARYPRRRGAATIRGIFEAGGIGTTRTRSPLEEHFLRFVRRFGLPEPELNAPIALGGRFVEADCLWRRERLIVELDGRKAHGTADAFERDRLRDRLLQLEGWRVVRVTSRQIQRDAARLEVDLRTLLAVRPGL